MNNIEEPMVQDKLFDNVEAFHRAMRGKKVRHVDWPLEWFITFGDTGGVITEHNRYSSIIDFFSKEARENDWEEYEEVISNV